ncbi:hypothetical protein R5R35_004728 [Gryllus longicercus]|uniref:CDAN1-interacting nuclease 1 n=1 Tax=Gryllus longicercus TaxID=2509291 RepID=A0AAN9Z373_9ORTH
MKEEDFNTIIIMIRSYTGSTIGSKRTLEAEIKAVFPDIPEKTIRNIYSFEYQRKMKRERPKHFKCVDNWYKVYLRRIPSSTGVLLQMAEELDISPALLARMILEKHYEEKTLKDDSQVSYKNMITQVMKDTSLIDDPILSYEIYLCILHDDQYGPISECVNYSTGQEYEYKLQKAVQELGIPFSDEEKMRTKGYDKTPDIKLEIPFAVDGFVVNWIESKALFGDEECHQNFLKDQFLSYWNRFGTGLVIYWFGHLDTLENHSKKKIIIRDHFPTEVTKLDPQVIDPTPIVL